MSIDISQEQARRFLANYHLAPTDLPGVFARLGTVQYDPLNPVGRNADLVLQARIPGYRVDDWQKAAYTERLIYDAWDKQACLIPVSDWIMRTHTREMYRPYHDREILQADPQLAPRILSAIDAQGPLSSLEFEGRVRIGDEPHSWSGQTDIKRVLRALWVSGILVTHHRKSGRHYYDRPERVIPAQYYTQQLTDAETYHRWIMARRYQAVGLLRPNAETAIWSACGNTAQRKIALAQLVEMGTLTPVYVGTKRWLYYMLTSSLTYLDAPLPTSRITLLGPLDSLLWDRKAVQQLFNFNYLWEVYKPLAQRRWGYYVLPVFYGDRFIARLDSRLIGKTWHILNWWWEDDVLPDADLYAALRSTFQNFLAYLQAQDIQAAEQIDPSLRELVHAITN
jgi:uncharacterized protein